MGNGRPKPTGLEALADTSYSDSTSVMLWMNGGASRSSGASGAKGKPAKRAKGTAIPAPAPAAAAAAAAEVTPANASVQPFERGPELHAGLQIVALTACDWNGDGKTDLAAAERGSQAIAIWLGKPPRAYEPAREIPVDGAPLDIAAGDIDGDGHQDLLVAISAASRGVGGWGLVTIPGGTAKPVTHTTWFKDATGFRLHCADVDGDGKLDLVVLAREGIVTLRGGGDGTFEAAHRTRFDSGGSFAVARIDDDATLDVAVAAPRALGVAILPGSGKGEFGGGQSLQAGKSPSKPVAADLDRDGRTDLVVPNSDGSTVTVFLAKPGGEFARSDIEVGEGPMSVACGDLDHDGDSDLVVANALGRSSQIVVLRNRGDGTFEARREIASGVDPALVAILDVNADGKPDLLVPRSNVTEVLLFTGNGDATFQPAARITTPQLVYVFALGDLNGDGRPDFMGADARKGVATGFLGNGDGTFTATPSIRLRIEPASLAIADMNGDGKSDLVEIGRRLSNAGMVLAGNGDGTFGQRVDFKVGQGAGPATVADVDGDGKLDLVMPDAQGGTVSVVARNADGTYAAPRDYGLGSDPSGVLVGDFDGDGIVDLVAASHGADNVVILHGRPR
jgi:hypothetical protein